MLVQIASIYKKMIEKNQGGRQLSKDRNHLKVEQANRQVNQSKKQEKKIKPSNKKTKKKQADDKSARIKKAKIIRKLFTWTILLGIIIGVLVFLCRSEIFKICDIEITGNSQVSQETILSLTKIELEDNIFLANTIKAKSQISKNAYIEEVKIKKVLPDKIKIEIIEKEKAYMLQVDDKYAYIDKNGDVLEVSESNIENLIILQGYLTAKDEIVAGNKLNKEDLERLEDLQKILKNCEKIELNDKIASINIKDKNDYILNLPTYKKILYMGDTSNLSTKVLYAKDILEKTTDQEGKIFVNGKFNKGFDPYFREESNN